MKPLPAGHCQCDSTEANRHLLTVEQARALASELVSGPVRQELVSLTSSLGRIAAKDLHAPKPMPFFNNSAMDGYAIQTERLKGEGPFVLKVVGESAAGSSANMEFEAESALRIYTGAPVPEGFDAVIAQENCKAGSGVVEFEQKPASGQNIRYKGSDMERGACLLSKGTRIAPHHLGLLAANGYSAINVFAKPRVAVFSTGDELVEPGQPLKDGQIYDCNKPMLIALLASMGINAVDLGALPDDPIITQDFLSKHGDKFDLLISSGSVSVGARDFLKSAFEAVGGHIRSWKVAVKPGKPVMFGKLGRTVFTGLPGNPFAVFVGFNLFVRPQLKRMAGQSGSSMNWQEAKADFLWNRKPGRTEVFPVKVVRVQSTGEEKLKRLGNSVSATLFPLATADGLAMVPPDCDEIRPGDLIQWHAFC